MTIANNPDVHPQHLKELLEPDRCVALIVDMQNDYCAAGGVFDQYGLDIAPCQAIVAEIARLCRDARARHQIPIIAVRTRHDEPRTTTADDPRKRWLGGPSGHCVPGTWGFEFVDGLELEPTDFIFEKENYSAFVGTTLANFLRLKERNVLIVMGCATEVCVESTVRSAYHEGFYSVIPQDAVASHDAEAHRASLKTMGNYFGYLSSVDNIIRSLD